MSPQRELKALFGATTVDRAITLPHAPIKPMQAQKVAKMARPLHNQQPQLQRHWVNGLLDGDRHKLKPTDVGRASWLRQSLLMVTTDG